jgi:hypothetical protein
MQANQKVTGTYFGIKFVGTVQEVWNWSHKFVSGEDSVFIDLDSPIVVNGVERKMISWKPNRFSTIQSAQ